MGQKFLVCHFHIWPDFIPIWISKETGCIDKKMRKTGNCKKTWYLNYRWNIIRVKDNFTGINKPSCIPHYLHTIYIKVSSLSVFWHKTTVKRQVTQHEIGIINQGVSILYFSTKCKDMIITKEYMNSNEQSKHLWIWFVLLSANTVIKLLVLVSIYWYLIRNRL